MKTISITISKKAYDNLKWFAHYETMTESKVIETLLTWEVPPHCEDMVVGDGSRKGDGTFAALIFDYRYWTVTDLHREDYEAKIKELSKVTDPEGLKNLGYKLVQLREPFDFTCGECGCSKALFDAWQLEEPFSYRIFSVCDTCGHREEW